MKLSGNETLIYVASVPEQIIADGIFPIARREEIESVSNAAVKRSKYGVWKLLEYALKDAHGLTIRDVPFVKNGSGKWTSPWFEFSLSHSFKVVCVALSSKPVGVDVQLVRELKNGFAERILSERERAEYNAVSQIEQTQYLISRWTQKESIFKQTGGESFVPKRIETTEFAHKTFSLNISESDYILTVACDNIDGVKLITDVKI